MAKKIEAWTEFGPRLAPATPLSGDELLEQITGGSNESASSVLAVLAALDRVVGQSLKAGRIVRLPNGLHYRPIGKKDGVIKVHARVNPHVLRAVNERFRGRWHNAANIGASAEQVYAQWDEAHPDDPIEQ